jgi:hypothetical protein
MLKLRDLSESHALPIESVRESGKVEIWCAPQREGIKTLIHYTSLLAPPSTSFSALPIPGAPRH